MHYVHNVQIVLIFNWIVYNETAISDAHCEIEISIMQYFNSKLILEYKILYNVFLSLFKSFLEHELFIIKYYIIYFWVKIMQFGLGSFEKLTTNFQQWCAYLWYIGTFAQVALEFFNTTDALKAHNASPPYVHGVANATVNFAVIVRRKRSGSAHIVLWIFTPSLLYSILVKKKFGSRILFRFIA